MSYSFENSLEFWSDPWFCVKYEIFHFKTIAQLFLVVSAWIRTHNFEFLRAENPYKIQAILLKSYIELDLVQLKSCLFKFLTLFALAFKKVNPLVVKRLILALTSVTFESLEYLCVVLSLLMKNMERTGGTLPIRDHYWLDFKVWDVDRFVKEQFWTQYVKGQF